MQCYYLRVVITVEEKAHVQKVSFIIKGPGTMYFTVLCLGFETQAI